VGGRAESDLGSFEDVGVVRNQVDVQALLVGPTSLRVGHFALHTFGVSARLWTQVKSPLRSHENWFISIRDGFLAVKNRLHCRVRTIVYRKFRLLVQCFTCLKDSLSAGAGRNQDAYGRRRC